MNIIKGNDIWLAVSVNLSEGDKDIASSIFYDLGCNGISENPDGLTAFFDGKKHDEDALRDAISKELAAFPALAYVQIEITSEYVGDWSERWKQHFKPFEIAPGVIVAPSWEAFRPEEGQTAIELDPGMAFGTGLHPTTRLCASSLVSILHHTKIPRPSLLDLGTGSGILSILGRKLDLGRIAAVDNDPDALRVARENLSKNDCADVEMFGDIRDVEGRFQIVIANILLSTLIELRPEIEKRSSPGGWLVLSGITHDQEVEISTAFSGSFSDAVIYRDGEWSAIVCRRRN